MTSAYASKFNVYLPWTFSVIVTADESFAALLMSDYEGEEEFCDGWHFNKQLKYGFMIPTQWPAENAGSKQQTNVGELVSDIFTLISQYSREARLLNI